MHETTADLAALQALLDESMANAGSHLASILTSERRLTALDVCDRLTGMRLLALATATADGRPLVGVVDGIFYRGAFYFGSSPDAVRIRHIRRRPSVSATHAPSEALAVTVHGTAHLVDVAAPAQAGFRQALLSIYVPRYGERWEAFLDAGALYARITAEKMFAFASGDPEP